MKPQRRDPTTDHGFSRMELIVTTMMLALLGAMAIPILASNRNASDLVVCKNNLGRLGKAFNIWGAEQGSNQRPWWVLESSGGTRPDLGTKPGSAWREYAILSSILPSPQVLVCPSDIERRERWAREWSTSADRGLYNARYRDNAVSYFVGLHALFDNPRSLLSGDANLPSDNEGTACAVGVNNASGLRTEEATQPYLWRDNIHGTTGNLLLNSGEVISVDNPELTQAIVEAAANFSTLHYLVPR